MTYTQKTFAEMLEGREIGHEINREEAKLAKECGLVVVYGYSDDNVEFEGAISDELGAWDGETFHVTKGGEVAREDNNPPELFEGATIRALWCDDQDSPPWKMETDIPNAEKFHIMEDGEVFCEGIVFALADVPG